MVESAFPVCKCLHSAFHSAIAYFGIVYNILLMLIREIGSKKGEWFSIPLITVVSGVK